MITIRFWGGIEFKVCWYYLQKTLKGLCLQNSAKFRIINGKPYIIIDDYMHVPGQGYVMGDDV